MWALLLNKIAAEKGKNFPYMSAGDVIFSQ